MSRDTGRRQRLGHGLAAALIGLAIAAPLGWYGFSREKEAIRSETVFDAQTGLNEAFRYSISDDFDPPANVWRVNVDEEWSDAYGETWTSPPLLALGESVVEGDTSLTDYSLDGEWTAKVEWLGGADAIVAVVDRSYEMKLTADARRTWILRWLGSGLVMGLIGLMVSSRLAAPVREARMVNSDFIADAAHELRTPLSIIQASAGHALSRERDPEAYRESLTEILAATERAGASVGELLEFARLESGQSTVRSAALRLDLLVEEVVASIRVDGVTIDASEGEAVVVDADYNLIRQVVDNITHNAAARASEVSLVCRTEGDDAVIEVSDNGPGFDPGVIDHVFERFRRGDRSGAIGLGMAVARTIVELHGGTVAADNRAEGGALVTIRLPRDS